jgi:formylmethanofuran dehydrogenase subunit E
MALGALSWLGVDPEREPKRLLVYVEIDRCAADAIGVVTGCRLGKRTLKHVDYGKMAATFVDLKTRRAVRVAALESARALASAYAPAGLPRDEAQLIAYKAMPDEEVYGLQEVQVHISPYDLPGHALRRVVCARCGETINDCREVISGDEVLCRACAYGAYYEPVASKDGAALPALQPAAWHVC